MSIQKRLLLIYASIFTVASLLFALIVYFLPRNWILAEIDKELEGIFSGVQAEIPVLNPGGMARLTISEDLASFETASIFMIIVDAGGNIVARSNNLIGFDELLDPNGRSTGKQFSQVRHGDALLRVLTVPLVVANGTEPIIIGHMQVARPLDNYETFNQMLVVALILGFGAAAALLVLAILLTPNLFKPLDDIATVAQQITRADDLSRRVPDMGRTDEIGALARAVNQTLERLERLFRAQQRLLADVSHELRTPLTAIRGNVDLMRRMGEADLESLEIIQDEVERMTRLVGDLLLLARADAGGLPLAREPVELDNVFFEVYRQASLLDKRVEVMVTAVDQVCVLGDVDRLKQLLINLVGNAVKYTPPGGKVYLNLSKADGWALVEITDTGVGIPPEDLPYIFDRFYRVDKARSRAQGGSGLGLSIAQWIAQTHGGDIYVKSQAGEGTTFTVRLPAVMEKSLAQIEEELEKTRPSLRLLGMGKQKSG